MNSSFHKTKTENRQDYSKSVLKQLELDEEIAMSLHPVVKFIMFFLVVSVIFASIVLVIN